MISRRLPTMFIIKSLLCSSNLFPYMSLKYLAHMLIFTIVTEYTRATLNVNGSVGLKGGSPIFRFYLGAAAKGAGTRKIHGFTIESK